MKSYLTQAEIMAKLSPEELDQRLRHKEGLMKIATTWAQAKGVDPKLANAIFTAVSDGYNYGGMAMISSGPKEAANHVLNATSAAVTGFLITVQGMEEVAAFELTKNALDLAMSYNKNFSREKGPKATLFALPERKEPRSIN